MRESRHRYMSYRCDGERSAEIVSSQITARSGEGELGYDGGRISVWRMGDGPSAHAVPQLIRLWNGVTDGRIDGMAVIERIGRPEARPYLVAWGTLTEEDEQRLLARVLTSRHVDVTVDLCEVEEVTDQGCEAIRNVAEYMGDDQTMVLLYIPDREATRSLERAGIADDGRIVLVASSPNRRTRV